ncbi:MAG: peroxiredoxin [Patescibacteria group bacterium]|nr:MAG: peroxiredoxin [Patescibacteria group bacterium]
MAKRSPILAVGEFAPDFALTDQYGKMRNLSEFLGKWLLLYFYPKDNTPGCTTEACSIRDIWDDFKKLGIEVVGISTDSVESHKKFAEKHNLPFTLLSDPDKEAVQKYGVWGIKSFMGKSFLGTRRTSFLINPQGKIEKVYEKVNPQRHAEEVLQDIQALI